MYSVPVWACLLNILQIFNAGLCLFIPLNCSVLQCQHQISPNPRTTWLQQSFAISSDVRILRLQQIETMQCASRCCAMRHLTKWLMGPRKRPRPALGASWWLSQADGFPGIVCTSSAGCESLTAVLHPGLWCCPRHYRAVITHPADRDRKHSGSGWSIYQAITEIHCTLVTPMAALVTVRISVDQTEQTSGMTVWGHRIVRPQSADIRGSQGRLLEKRNPRDNPRDSDWCLWYLHKAQTATMMVITQTWPSLIRQNMLSKNQIPTMRHVSNLAGHRRQWGQSDGHVVIGMCTLPPSEV